MDTFRGSTSDGLLLFDLVIHGTRLEVLFVVKASPVVASCSTLAQAAVEAGARF